MSRPLGLDADAPRQLEDSDYVWSDLHNSFVRSRRLAEPMNDYTRQFPITTTFEDLSDNGAFSPTLSPQERHALLRWLAQCIQDNG